MLLVVCQVLLGSEEASDGAGVRCIKGAGCWFEAWVQTGYLHQCHTAYVASIGICT